MKQNLEKDLPNTGPIFRLFYLLIELSRYLSLVEFFKFCAEIIARKKDRSIPKYINTAIDLFTMFKWGLIGVLWLFHSTNMLWTVVAVYLLLFNLQSYFYYHVWDLGLHNYGPITPLRQRRRFVALMLAFFYSDFVFAYIFRFPLDESFTWTTNFSKSLSAILFSIGNSLTGFAGTSAPQTQIASVCATAQLLVSGIFLTIILAQSIPQIGTNHNHGENNGKKN